MLLLLPPRAQDAASEARRLQQASPAFTVTSTTYRHGLPDCGLINGGSCVTDGFANYERNERCTITANVAMTLVFTEFETGTDGDGTRPLTIGGQSYSGSTAPTGLSLAAGDTIQWSSPGALHQFGGFTICAQPRPPDAFTVTAGSSYCEVTNNGRCVTDGAGNYGNGERCTITANIAMTPVFTEFATESGWDYLTIGGQQYSGTNAPTGLSLAAGDTIAWYTDDEMVQDTGFTICMAMPPMPPTPSQPPPFPPGVRVVQPGRGTLQAAHDAASDDDELVLMDGCFLKQDARSVYNNPCTGTNGGPCPVLTISKSLSLIHI